MATRKRTKLVLAFALTSAAVAAGVAVHHSSPPYEMPQMVRGLTQAQLKDEFRRPAQIDFPDYNPFSEEKRALGRQLFFDPRLSGNNQMSCATCHRPDQNWTDGLPTARGHEGKTLSRKTPTLWNAAWMGSFFWDGRAPSLEEQALGPIQAEDEMNQQLPELMEELRGLEEYRKSFGAAFPQEKEPITPKTVAAALATFQRTLMTAEAPFDRWMAGDEGAVSPLAKEGFVLFNTKAQCVSCHKGWNFTDNGLKDTGLITDDRGFSIEGRESVRFLFKTPTLRNVAARAPFMHDGTVRDLEGVIEFYDRGGIARRPSLSEFMSPLNLTRHEKRALKAFLQSLSGPDDIVLNP